MISTFTALIDSNVFYGARLRSLVLFVAQTKLFRARWSEFVHDEWVRNLVADRPDLTHDAARDHPLLRDAIIFLMSIIVAPLFRRAGLNAVIGHLVAGMSGRGQHRRIGGDHQQSDGNGSGRPAARQRESSRAGLSGDPRRQAGRSSGSTSSA